MSQIKKLQILPIVPEIRKDVSEAAKVSSILVMSAMSKGFIKIITKLLPYLQGIIDVEHKQISKHASQLLRHVADYSFPNQVDLKFVVINETTCNTCFLKCVMHGTIHPFKVIITSCTRNVQKERQIKLLMVVRENTLKWPVVDFAHILSNSSSFCRRECDDCMQDIPESYVFLVEAKPSSQLCISLGSG